MSKTEKSYTLVIVRNGSEIPQFVSKDIREVELQRQIHIRSLAPGYAEIREVKD